MDNLYIHVPFCDGKCSYCAFYSVAYGQELADAYLEALAIELQAACLETGCFSPKTIYIGGGTPSVFDADQLDRLLEIIRLNVDTERLEEWTIEANPGALSARKLNLLAQAGINRVSFGVQSLDDDVLTSIGRRHDVDEVLVSIESARAYRLGNIGIDLIAGLPGVSRDLWRRILRKAASLAPRHMSVYGLSLEHGSRMEHAVHRGQLTVPGDEQQLMFIDDAEEALAASGYERYEISNYAKPGAECHHNVACWRGEDYLGFGPAAASRSGLIRRTNSPDVKAYIEALAAGQPAPCEEETLSHLADLSERMMFGMRLREGVDLADFSAAGDEIMQHWETALSESTDSGLVEKNGNRWCLTGKGRRLADSVIASLLPPD